MLVLMFACSTPTPPVTPSSPTSPSPTLKDDLRSLTQKVGLAARDSKYLCQAMTEAKSLTPKVQSALQSGDLQREELQTIPGLVMRGEKVRVDWIEFAQAVGNGATSAALITLGGVESVVYRPCVDVQQLSHWVNRTKSFQKTADCVQDLLTDKLEALLIEASHATCICEPPPEGTLESLSARIDGLGIEDQEFLRQWANSWKVCPSTQP